MVRNTGSGRRPGEAGYSWLYTANALHGHLRVLLTLLAIGLGAGFFAWYLHVGNDASPDSPAGYTYAGIGTMLLLLAAVLFSARRRSHRRRTPGGLRVALGWHMCFALIGLVFLGMHSFGELNPRSGTYALYGMIALVISGLIGRTLDRLVPRLIAGQANRVLNSQGDDRIEALSQKLQTVGASRDRSGGKVGASAPSERVPRQRGNWRDHTFHTPWDIAYISLQQELPQDGQHRFMRERTDTSFRHEELMSGAQGYMLEMKEVHRALQMEVFYRYLTRYWRRFHIALALLTLGLLVWHIVYALQLLLPLFLTGIIPMRG